MKKNYILLLILCLCQFGLHAQTLEQAKQLFQKNEFEKAKPVFLKYVKSTPNNASYNYWYGACCYETGEKAESEKYLLFGAKRKVQEAFRYLGQLYFDLYRFEESMENYEEYIALLEKKKQATDKYEVLLDKAKLGARMLKGVEEVTIIDSFVVDKNNFLEAYKISEESGDIFTFNDYFKQTGKNPGTVYQTELKNKLYYGDKEKNGNINIYTRARSLGDWGKASILPDVINTSANENFPYVLSDGATLYYASDGEGSLGGYDIFVTRYNTNTDNYLVPDNVGMPFNSPFNDYMYAVDEFNNLGWFASDRYQPENKVCIYVFIPNTSKQTYNYENTDVDLIRRAARIQSIKGTWKNTAEVKAAKQRLTMVIYQKPKEKKVRDFEFVIDDNTTYYTFDEFTSPNAKNLFKQWEQKTKDFRKLEQQLEKQRDTYIKSNKATRSSLAPGILDMEKRIEQVETELKQMEVNIRNEEKRKLSK